MPRPTVGSAVIRLVRYQENPVTVTDEARMFAMIKAAFGQRRKTLINSLSHAPALGISKGQITDALEKMQLDCNIRGEALTLEQFARLSMLISF